MNGKAYLLIVMLLGCVSCKVLVLSDPEPALSGPREKVTARSGCLFPYTGPMEARTNICQGQPVERITLISGFSCLLTGSEMDVEFACADGSVSRGKLDADTLAAYDEQGVEIELVSGPENSRD